MTLELNKIRQQALMMAGLPFRQDVTRTYGLNTYTFTPDIKLPADFSMEPTPINGVYIRILTTQEARTLAPKAVVAHRILAKCPCGRWIYAGKLNQHQKACREIK